MKKIIYLSLAFILLLSTLTGCMNNDNETLSSTMSEIDSTIDGTSSKSEAANKPLGAYDVNIKGYRLAKDTEGKDIVIINYNFINNSDDSASFTFAISDKVFQNDVGLSKCYTADKSAKYSSDNQSKEIKKGASIEVEVAYYLNDNENPIEIECSELISLNDDKVTKTFNIK